ncbi:PAS domain S-box protein [Dissulfurispira thermophila]|nr:PAS domain S-box protein [Dissulfurispira thermophila]
MVKVIIRLAISVFSIFIVLCSLPGYAFSSNKDTFEIKVAASIYEPFVFYEDGKLSGFDIDLLDTICKSNNIRYTIQVVPFQEMLSMLKEGKADIGIGAIYVTEERKAFINFTAPYLKTGIVYVIRADAQISSNLTNKTIGVKKTATGEAIARNLAKKFLNLKVITFDSTEDSLDALVDGKVDVVLNDYINTSALMHDKYRGKIKIKKGLLDLPQLLTNDYIAFAVNKQKRDLFEQIDTSIRKIVDSGMMKSLLERWQAIHTLPNYRKFIAYGLFIIIGTGLLIISIFRYHQKKQFYQLMHESEQRYRAITEHSPDAIITADLDGNIIFLNESAQKFFGYSSEELLGKSLTMLIPDACKSEHIFGFNRFIKTGKSHIIGKTYEIAGKKKDGTEFPIELSLSTWHIKGNRFFTGILRDITEKKKIEERLIDSESRFRSAIQEAPNPVIIHCDDGSIVLVNKRFTELTGYSLNQIDTFEKFANLAFPDPEYRQIMKERYQKIIDEGISQHGEDINFTCSDGSVRIWNIQLSHIGSWGDKKAVMCIARDVTEQRKLEEQLRQMQKMEVIGRFTGGIAHDFNNYLTAITGFSQLALMQIDNNHPARRNIENVVNSAEKASVLTRQLLAFSRRQVMQPQVVNLNTIVIDMTKIIKRIIGEDIQLRTVLDPDLWNVRVDPGQIEQVIMNLVSNARDAMPNGGMLTIQTTNALLDEEYAKRHVSVIPGNYVMIAVEDTGVGMTEDIKSHIFEPFFTTKELGKGTGLGLATVYGIIKQSGGNIWVYSEPGQGTIFKIYLPKSEEKVTSYVTTERIDTIPSGTETLLVVEDNNDVRDFITTVLKNIGYNVLEARDGIEALIICNENKGEIDLIITDVVMPNMSGDKLASRVKDLYPKLKVLYMSGYADNIITEKGILKEGINYLQKPLTAVTLAQTIRKVLDS